jgi:hypothetical protein
VEEGTYYSRNREARLAYSRHPTNRTRNHALQATYRANAASLRRELIDRAGGACLLCGWRPQSEIEYAAIDLHHAIPREKRFGVNATTSIACKPVSEVLAEACKCVPLCAICHRIHHQKVA